MTGSTQSFEQHLLTFVPADDQILHRKCRELTPSEIRSIKIQQLITNLLYTVKNNNRGVGLSANQVGRNEAVSVVAIKPTPARPHLQPFDKVYINTKITKTFGEKFPMWEGCLSTVVDRNNEPSMAQVPRYQKIQIEYFDQNGQEAQEIVEGFLAHVIQHETDHLGGILFTDLIDPSTMIPYQDYIKLTQTG